MLAKSYGADSRRVYYEKYLVKGADPATFEVMERYWGRDRNGVYYGGGRIAGADPTTFRILSSDDFLGKDRNAYYIRDKKVDESEAIPPGGTVPGLPLHTAKDMDMFRDYLARGATPNDWLALGRACRNGNFEMLQLMLQAGCNPNLGLHGGASALTAITYTKNYMDLAILLVESGADVNQMPRFPNTDEYRMLRSTIHSPLEWALNVNKLDLAEYLVQKGAHVNILTGEGIGLIEHFKRRGNVAAVEFLQARGALPFV